MTKQKWVIAIACGVAVGAFSFVWSVWQSSSGNRTDEPVLPAFSPPAIELPTPSLSDPTPAPSSESQSPRNSTHVATVTLGDFQHFGGLPDQQRGWFTNGVDELWSPYTAQQFTESRFLILEFEREPYGEIEFAWIGDSNDWVWTVTTFMPEGRILIINLLLIDESYRYRQGSYLKIYLNCYDDSWENLIITDAYFANIRR
jgi:hypothetical protein